MPSPRSFLEALFAYLALPGVVAFVVDYPHQHAEARDAVGVRVGLGRHALESRCRVASRGAGHAKRPSLSSEESEQRGQNTGPSEPMTTWRSEANDSQSARYCALVDSTT